MVAAEGLAEVHQALQWIGFGNQDHCDSICEKAWQMGMRSVPKHKVAYLLGCEASSSLLE